MKDADYSKLLGNMTKAMLIEEIKHQDKQRQKTRRKVSRLKGAVTNKDLAIVQLQIERDELKARGKEVFERGKEAANLLRQVSAELVSVKRVVATFGIVSAINQPTLQKVVVADNGE